MNRLPLFSVLIANYNNTCYLKEAVESIKAQTYKNWEIIIVDDFSTDGAQQLYNKLEEDLRIKVYYNDKNYGCGFTKRRLVALANGPIFGFLDPDDAIEETAIKITVEKHLQLPDYSLIYSLNYVCDEQLNVVGLTKWGGRIPEGENQLTAPPGKKITSFATFKKNYYYKTAGINPKFTRGFDQDFFYKMEEVGKVYCIEEPLYFYRIHSNNISLNQNHVKALYWLYEGEKDAYYRRKNNKLNIKNITYGDVQRTYLKVCLLKIEEKLSNKQFKNIFYYYCQIIRLAIWDKEFLILRNHIKYFKMFFKRLTRL